MTKFSIRRAKICDIDAIHLLGVSTPELKVSNLTEFMSVEEINKMISNPDGILLVAESNDQIIGFCYGILDKTNGVKNGKACLVYITIIDSFRKQGAASKLYESIVDCFKQYGAKYLYSWANPDSGITCFFAKKGMRIGETRVWFDKLL